MKEGFGMTRIYTSTDKQNAIELYYKENTLKNVIAKLGYPSLSTLQNWVQADPRWDKMYRPCTHHDFETKIACVSAYLDAGMTCRRIGKLYQVSPSQVCRWTKKYLEYGKVALEPKKRRKVSAKKRNINLKAHPPTSTNQVPDEKLREYCEELQFQNDVLKAKLDFLEKKAQASARKTSPTKKKRS